MSEVKFACPVCGQHITADSSQSGGQLECPTCFRKIIIPEASSSLDSKLVVSAAEVGKPRPVSPIIGTEPVLARRSRTPVIAAISILALLLAAGAAAYLFRDKLFRHATNTTKDKKTVSQPKTHYPIPTNIVWSLAPANVSIPDSNPVGSVRGSGFMSERAVLQGGTLNLRQGASYPPDLGISIQFFAKLGEELSKKTIEITPDRPPPVPKVTLRWKDDQGKAATKTFSSGYALRVEFGEAANGRISGKIFVSLPDPEKSFAAGSFNAEIRKPPAPKAKQPKKRT